MPSNQSSTNDFHQLQLSGYVRLTTFGLDRATIDNQGGGNKLGEHKPGQLKLCSILTGDVAQW